MGMNFQGMGGMMGMPNMNQMNQLNNNFQGMGGMMGMSNNNMSQMNIPQMNIGGGPNNEDWLVGYNMAMNEMQNNNQSNVAPAGKVNVIFKTTQGVVTNLLIDYGKTMGELIKTYLARMGKPELYGKKDGICFLYNATKIEFDSKTTIEDFFHYTPNPNIIVNDVNSLIGA